MAINNKISLFIDESGKPDLFDSTYKRFILTGVIIPEDEIPVVSGYFSYIKRRYKFSDGKPFHTYDLLENPETRLTLTEAKSFISSMCEFIETCPINVLIIETNKDMFRRIYENQIKDSNLIKKRGEKGIIYFLSAYKQFQIFVDYLEKNNVLGQIFADSRYNQDRDLLDAFLKLKDSDYKRGVINPYSKRSRELMTSITFANKFSLSGGLELTDFISFVSFNKLDRRMSKFKDIHLRKTWLQIENKLMGKDIYSIDKKVVEIWR